MEFYVIFALFFYALGLTLIWRELFGTPTLATKQANRHFPYKRKKGG
ncbi:MAG: hypothetical protein R3Y07_03100 [Eubacteriales bacterium]